MSVPTLARLRISSVCFAAMLALLAVSGCGGGWGDLKPTIAIEGGKSETVTAGETATFSVTALGTAPFTYQWYLNGVAIQGATSSSYTTGPTVSSQNGSVYTVAVSNVAGSLMSSALVLTVNTPPAIIVQPESQTILVGQTATFAVTATGTAPLAYQWYLGGTAISGATSSSYTTPTTTAIGNSSVYTVKVTNVVDSVTSSPATLTVNPLVPTLSFGSIGAQTYGASAFTVSATSASSGAVTYSVTSGPATIAGNTVTLTGIGTVVLGASQAANGDYTAATASTSFTVTANVIITPITPANSTMAPGQQQTFSATASGGPTNTLTWTATGGSISSSGVWTPPDTAGTYIIKATSVDNPSVFVTTTATISIPMITSQPVSKNVCAGYSPSFTISASYASSYLWTEGGNPVGTSSTLIFNNVTAASDGNYMCTVTNGAGSVVSNTVTLNVLTPTTLSITSNPSSVSVYATQTATFSVSATGTGTLAYQWYTGTPGSGMIISSATSSTYTTGALTTANSGTTYYVTVTDTDCTDTTLTSTAATLTVTNTDTAVPPTIIIQPTGQTATVGGTATFSVTASGPGTLTYQWYRVPYETAAYIEANGPTAGVAVSGATSSTYTVPASETAQSNDGDNYYVVVENAYGTAQSVDAPLAIGNGILLQVTGQPQTVYVAAGSLASFTVTATCTGCIPAYQWYWSAPGSTSFTALADGAISSGTLNGATVGGATTSSLTLESVPSSASGSIFYAVVTSTSDGTTQIIGTNPISSNNAAMFVGSLGSINNLCSNTWVLNGNTPGYTSGDVPYQNTTNCTIELTNDQGNEHAAIYWPTLISTAKFTVNFTVTIAAGSNPADGFTMILADPSQGATTSSMGATGEGLGARGIPGFVLGFDTYQNGDIETGSHPGSCTNSNPNGACDPMTVPYMAVGQGATNLWENPWTYVNGNLDTAASTDYPDGTFTNATHAYVVTVVGGVMTVTIDGNELFSGPVKLPSVAYLGFTASTGGEEESVTISGLSATVSAP
ncbi:MAG: immunoglobulin domain-containing protein [Terriglobales bacterium]